MQLNVTLNVTQLSINFIVNLNICFNIKCIIMVDINKILLGNTQKLRIKTDEFSIYTKYSRHLGIHLPTTV